MIALVLVGVLLAVVVAVMFGSRRLLVLAAVVLVPLAGVVPASANMHTDRVAVGA